MKRRVIVFIGIIFLSGFIFFNFVPALGNQPGSEEDPLVTLSYLNKKIQELETMLSQKVNNVITTISVLDKKVEEISNQTGQKSGGVFELVNLYAGQKLVCESGTEIILRSGRAKVIGALKTGLSDVTLGKDIASGTYVTKDHLLIVPRTDGRGIIAEINSIIMVKGKYSVQ